MNRIDQAKNIFLEKYNPKKEIETALSKAMSSASQHNGIFNLNQTVDKAEIKEYWQQLLQEKSEKYKNKVSEEDFLIDIKNIKQSFNVKYTGFRISHAQKSFALFLKHLWLMGEIQMPPLPALDKNILNYVGDKHTSWTKIDSIDEYTKVMNLIKDRAKKEGLHVTIWELLRFANVEDSDLVKEHKKDKFISKVTILGTVALSVVGILGGFFKKKK